MKPKLFLIWFCFGMVTFTLALAAIAGLGYWYLYFFIDYLGLGDRGGILALMGIMIMIGSAGFALEVSRK